MVQQLPLFKSERSVPQRSKQCSRYGLANLERTTLLSEAVRDEDTPKRLLSFILGGILHLTLLREICQSVTISTCKSVRASLHDPG